MLYLFFDLIFQFYSTCLLQECSHLFYESWLLQQYSLGFFLPLLPECCIRLLVGCCMLQRCRQTFLMLPLPGRGGSREGALFIYRTGRSFPSLCNSQSTTKPAEASRMISCLRLWLIFTDLYSRVLPVKKLACHSYCGKSLTLLAPQGMLFVFSDSVTSCFHWI